MEVKEIFHWHFFKIWINRFGILFPITSENCTGPGSKLQWFEMMKRFIQKLGIAVLYIIYLEHWTLKTSHRLTPPLQVVSPRRWQCPTRLTSSFPRSSWTGTERGSGRGQAAGGRAGAPRCPDRRSRWSSSLPPETWVRGSWRWQCQQAGASWPPWERGCSI